MVERKDITQIFYTVYHRTLLSKELKPIKGEINNTRNRTILIHKRIDKDP